MHRSIHLSLAALPGYSPDLAMGEASIRAQEGLLQEELWGAISLEEVQLVPQSFGHLSEDSINELQSKYVQTQFRLHANPRIGGETFLYSSVANSHLQGSASWYLHAARLSRSLGARAYSANAGLRNENSMLGMLNNARRLSDVFNCPVAVEGLFPNRHDNQLVSTWAEYRELFESGVPYALDLSHLNIVAVKSAHTDMVLTQEMLACERCIEVHVSENNGFGDSHQMCSSTEIWWVPLMPFINPHATVFTEGNHRLFKPLVFTKESS